MAFIFSYYPTSVRQGINVLRLTGKIKCLVSGMCVNSHQLHPTFEAMGSNKSLMMRRLDNEAIFSINSGLTPVKAAEPGVRKSKSS